MVVKRETQPYNFRVGRENKTGRKRRYLEAHGRKWGAGKKKKRKRNKKKVNNNPGPKERGH